MTLLNDMISQDLEGGSLDLF